MPARVTLHRQDIASQGTHTVNDREHLPARARTRSVILPGSLAKPKKGGMVARGHGGMQGITTIMAI
eukprot:2411927-Prorocentrum_lima.AAC.1